MDIGDKTEDDIIYVNSYGKNLDYSEELFIIEENNNLTEESIDTFNDIVIDSINQLKNTIVFLREEIQEENLSINSLLLRNLNGSCDKVDADLLREFQQSYVVETIQANKSLNNLHKLAYNYDEMFSQVEEFNRSYTIDELQHPTDDTSSINSHIENSSFNSTNSVFNYK